MSNRKVIILLIGRLAQAAMSVLSLKLMTQFLSISEIGQQYLINSMILWFSLVLINPVGMFVNRNINDWKIGNTLRFYLKKLNFYFISISLLSLLIATLLALSTDMFSGYQFSNVVVYFSLYVYFSTWFQTLVSMFNLFNHQKHFVILNLMALFLGLVFAYLGVTYIGPTSFAWLGGLLLGQIITLIYGYYLFYKLELSHLPNVAQDEKNQPEGLFSKKTLHFCAPIAITTFFMWFFTQGYRIFVERFAGVETIASLGIGLGLAASLAAIVESVTSQYLYPAYYASLTNSTAEVRVKSWKVLWGKSINLYIPSLFALLPLSVFLMKYVISKPIEGAFLIFSVGLVIEISRLLNNVIYISSHAENRTKNNLFPYFLGAASLLVYLLMFIVFGQINYLYCVIGLLISNGIVLFLNTLSINKLLSIKISYYPIIKSAVKSSPQVLIFALCYYFKDTNIFIIGSLCVLAGLYYLWIVRKLLN